MEESFLVKSVAEAKVIKQELAEKIKIQKKAVDNDQHFKALNEAVYRAQEERDRYAPFVSLGQLSQEYGMHRQPVTGDDRTTAAYLLYNKKVMEFLATNFARSFFNINFSAPCYYGGTDFLGYGLYEFSKTEDKVKNLGQRIIGFESFMSCAHSHVNDQHRLEVFIPKKEISNLDLAGYLDNERIKSKENSRRGIFDSFAYEYKNRVEEFLFRIDLNSQKYGQLKIMKGGAS